MRQRSRNAFSSSTSSSSSDSSDSDNFPRVNVDLEKGLRTQKPTGVNHQKTSKKKRTKKRAEPPAVSETLLDKLEKMSSETDALLESGNGVYGDNIREKKKAVFRELGMIKEVFKELDPGDMVNQLNLQNREVWLQQKQKELSVPRLQATLTPQGGIGEPVREDLWKYHRKHTVNKQTRPRRVNKTLTEFYRMAATPVSYSNMQTSPFQSRASSRQISRQPSQENLADLGHNPEIPDIGPVMLPWEINQNPQSLKPSHPKKADKVEQTPIDDVQQEPFYDFPEWVFEPIVEFDDPVGPSRGRGTQFHWAVMLGILYDLDNDDQWDRFNDDYDAQVDLFDNHPEVEYLDDQGAADWRQDRHT